MMMAPKMMIHIKIMIGKKMHVAMTHIIQNIFRNISLLAPRPHGSEAVCREMSCY